MIGKDSQYEEHAAEQQKNYNRVKAELELLRNSPSFMKMATGNLSNQGFTIPEDVEIQRFTAGLENLNKYFTEKRTRSNI